jgi:class 3 adenylate cyclase
MRVSSRSMCAVNVAARLVAEAAPHQVLVTGSVVQRTGSLDGIEFVPVGTAYSTGYGKRWSCSR